LIIFFHAGFPRASKLFHAAREASRHESLARRASSSRRHARRKPNIFRDKDDRRALRGRNTTSRVADG
jgi:hypothetical protein